MVGLPGEKIEIRDKKILINENYIQDPWGVNLKEEMPKKSDNFGPVSIPSGKYFVLGDNRDRSLDSRFWGFVDRSQIRGKALYIYWARDKSRIAVTLR